ncbi:MAG: molybdenum cofactor biosynthesis protein MoaE [Campylobacter sp.]|nr:molybdenum cofactor biosynthesis protein MoaE [Campylobacter sp.]
MEIYEGALDVVEIYNRWYDECKKLNLGAFISFAGIVRDDDNTKALSFDIYEPLLKKWFNECKQRAEKEGAYLFFAHSKGDVIVGQSSYLAAVVSKHRKVALKIIDEYVESFKANAPIWKYDIKNGKRIYASKRSQKLPNAGILKG